MAQKLTRSMAQLVGRHATPPTSLRGSLSLEATYICLDHFAPFVCMCPWANPHIQCVCVRMKRYSVCVCVLHMCLCVRFRLPFPKFRFPGQYLGDFNLQDLKGPRLHPVPFSWPSPAAGCTCSPCRGSRGRAASVDLFNIHGRKP
jgi:hypothetical protein